MSREDQRYVIRFRERARREINEALGRLSEITDQDHAISWYNGFLDALALLADNPNRNSVAYKSEYFRDIVYDFVYRLTARSVGYRVYYTVVDLVEDAPTVYILHIRHAARKPMTRAEAREIEKDE